MVLYILLACVLLLALISALLLIEIKKLDKANKGLSHVLEKSEANRTSSEKLKNRILSVLDDLPEGILIIDKDNEILFINRKAEKFLGINRKQVFNKPILELKHLSNVKKIVSPLLINFKGAHKEKVEVRKNFILDLSIEPLVLGKNNIAKLIILNDVTKINYVQSEKNQFISLAAHQLRSPLSAMGLALKMLLDQDFGKISKEQRNILEKTHKKNESLLYLLEDLLQEAKVYETGQFSNKSLVNLEDLVDPVADFYRDEMRGKKINFKFEKPSEKLPEVLADPEKIKMVIQNLFDNAVKYTPINGEIEVSIVPKKQELEFQIKDSGIGIPEDQKEKIFTRFSRAINVVKTKTVGAGLGLAIAKDIIEKHHGKIWFQSKENEGSTFFFSLPR